MKKIKLATVKVILGLFLLIPFTSCEEDVVDTSGITYKEQLVIKAFLFAGENATNIQITRTLHPLENYEYEKALVKDAKVAIIHNNQRYNLAYNSYSQTYENSEIIFKEGETYYLDASWKNLKATSRTTIPAFEIAKTYYNFERDKEGYYWLMLINAVPTGNNYCSFGGVVSEQNTYMDYDGLIDNFSDASLSVICGVRWFSSIADSSYQISLAKQDTYFLTAFDRSLWDYKTTRWAGSSGEDIFGNSGANVKWNINGDGIGLFIGSNKKEFKLE
jgi:hypothetical protein